MKYEKICNFIYVLRGPLSFLNKDVRDFLIRRIESN